MLQREVYFPWCRRNRYGAAKTPHSPLISLMVAAPHIVSNIFLSGFWHSGSHGTTFHVRQLILLIRRRFFDSSQDPIRAHFVNATKRYLYHPQYLLILLIRLLIRQITSFSLNFLI